MPDTALRYFDPTVNRFLRWGEIEIFSHKLLPDLLPIIPPGAPISAHAGPNITADKLGKIPGLRIDDGWIGFRDWGHADVSRETCVGWHDNMRDEQYGIGLNSRHINAFDVDTKDESFAAWAFDRLKDVGLAKNGRFSLVRVGRPPSFLIPFPADEGRKKDRKVFVNQLTGDANVIEWLATGQQFVVEGIHPKTMHPYTWHKATDLTTVAEIMAEHAAKVASWSP